MPTDNAVDRQEQYSFDYAGNNYFQGRDAVVTRLSDGASIKFNVKDGVLAVDVKDHSCWWNIPSISKIADELGEEKVEQCYENARESFWQNVDEVAGEHDLGPVYSSGRSGGWATIDNTAWLAGNGFHTEPMEAVLQGMEDEAEREEIEEEYRYRNEFLRCAFDIRGLMVSSREFFIELVVEAHDELEALRKMNENYCAELATD